MLIDMEQSSDYSTKGKQMVTGIILAGGRARRMGGRDKGLLKLSGKPMVEQVLDALKPQVTRLIINANRNLEAYGAYGYPVVADEYGEFCGPLAGMASGMKAATTPLVLTVPCDAPFIPDDLAARLYAALIHEHADLSVVRWAGRLQPVFTMMRSSLLPSILAFLETGERKIDKWFAEHHWSTADFADLPDAFININCTTELAAIGSGPT